MAIDEIRAARLKKLEILKEKGINPYPADSRRDISCQEASERFIELSTSSESLYMTGRIMSLRAQGKIIFLDIYDGTGRFQALLKSDEPLPVEQFELFEKAFDIGDFIEIKGTFFLTKKEEKTILVEELRMLSKSLRPLPEKWHGLQDVEERFRKRYLDILSNPEVRERFTLRTKIITEIRKILDQAGYLEVDTPVLQPLYGGASAEPFITHHKALDLDLYLRISDELYLKRLLTAGLPKVYEIARDFRNEGIDITHNPEFTMLEFYEAYSNAKEQMTFVENIIRRLAFLSNSKGKISFDEHEIDFSKPFEVMKYADSIKKHTQLSNPLEASVEDLIKEADRLGSKVEARDNSMKVLDAIFKKIRPLIIQPTFLIDYPLDMLPLTKRKEDNPKIVDAFQLYAGGIELVKAFSELNDPIDQRERFEVQEKNKEAGDKEAQPLDGDFLEAMEYGIPPAGGVGIGIDRLVMLLANVKNIKEVILFPALKPKDEKKNKELLTAVAVINSGVRMEKWQELNTIAHLTAAFGAREGKKLFYKDVIKTKDGDNIFLNIKHAIMIKKTGSSKKLREIVKKALGQGLKVADFTREMIETTNDKKVEENTKNKSIGEIEFLGALIFGEKKIVDDLTENLELYK